MVRAVLEGTGMTAIDVVIMAANMVHAGKRMDPIFGHAFICERCLPFDVSRASRRGRANLFAGSQSCRRHSKGDAQRVTQTARVYPGKTN